jgi:hypothetical protein
MNCADVVDPELQPTERGQDHAEQRQERDSSKVECFMTRLLSRRTDRRTGS